MKYVVAWKARASGSAQENEAGVARSLQVFGSWTAPSDSNFLQFLTRLDGEGGFAVVETDNPVSVLDGPAKFGPYFEFSVYPCMDIMEAVPVLSAGIEFRNGIS